MQSKKMRHIILLILVMGSKIIIGEQRTIDITSIRTHLTITDSTAILLLNNCLVPRAVMTVERNIICVAKEWQEQNLLIAEKIDSNGNKIWNNVILCVPTNTLDALGKVLILPRSDGGAYFVYEYLEFKSYEDHVSYYAKYPYIQLVDSDGSVKWSSTGRLLTDMLVNYQGGADLQNICFAPDGDIMIYWTWFNNLNVVGGENEIGTYVQKVHPANYEVKFGSSGKKLMNSRTSSIKQSNSGDVYLFQYSYNWQFEGDSVICLNSWAEKQWQLPLLKGIDNEFMFSTNENGELLIIYGTNEDLRASLYNNNGTPIWVDRVLTTSIVRVNASIIEQWGSDRWIFKIDTPIGSYVNCIDRSGNLLWSDSGVLFKNKVIAVKSLDEESVLISFINPNDSANYTFDLFLQNLDKNGDQMWQSEGVTVFDNVNTNCVILPDNIGGAYLIFDALTAYDPNYRPRGIYLQKIDKAGHLGLITSVSQSDTQTNSQVRIRSSCYPNPSRGIVTFELNSESDNSNEYPVEELKIYNILGSEVYSFNGVNAFGKKLFLRWDGKDKKGTMAAPGIYFYVIKTKRKIIHCGKFLHL